MQRRLLILYSIFLAWLFVSSLFSFNPYVSLLVTGLFIIYGVVIFVVAYIQKRESSFGEWVTHLIIYLALIASVVSIYNFFTDPTTFIYPRMRGFFDSHNVYAAFLLFPLLTSWRYALSARLKNNMRGVWVYGALASLFISQFILTFSRGMWLSTIVVAFVVIVMHRRQQVMKLLFDNQIIRKSSLWIAVAGIVLSFVIFWGGTLFQGNYDISQTPYSSESVIENGITARLHYMKDGIGLAEESVGVGKGPGMYDEALGMWKQEFEFYSAHSHNSLINLAAETGIPGLILGLMVGISFIILCLRYIRESGFEGTVSIACFAVLAILIHSLMDVDLEYRLIMMVLACLVGLILGNFEANKGKVNTFLPRKKILYILVITFIGIVIFALAGRLLLEPLNFKPYVQRGELLSEVAMNATSTDRIRMGEEALLVFDEALSRVECNQKAFTNKFFLLNMLGRRDAAIASLRDSIACNPTTAHDQYVLLVKMRRVEGDSQAALDVIHAVLPKYERYMAMGWFEMNTYKDRIRQVADSLRASRDELCRESSGLHGCDE